MSSDKEIINFQAVQPGNNFAAIGSENGASCNTQSLFPKFDTSLQNRSLPALSSSPLNTIGMTDKTNLHQQLSAPSNNGKKRSSHSIDDAAEDILEQICSQMNTLSTQDTNDDKIAAFMSVLACAQSEAAFFLESADWSVEAAVSLWLESGLGNVLADNNKRSRSMLHEDNGRNQYTRRRVHISGLSEDWSAWVSASSGHIYFSHNGTGHTQYNVPPRFADNVESRGDETAKHRSSDSTYDGMTRDDDEGERAAVVRNDRLLHSTRAHVSSTSFERDSEGESRSGDSCSVDGDGDVVAADILKEDEGAGAAIFPNIDSKAASAADIGNQRSSNDPDGDSGSGDSNRMF